MQFHYINFVFTYLSVSIMSNAYDRILNSQNKKGNPLNKPKASRRIISL